MIIIDARLEGAERVRRVLNDPGFIAVPAGALLSRIRSAALREVRRPLSKAGTGRAYSTIFARYDKRDMRVSVWSVMGLRTAQSIERGRSPGNAPSMRAIIRWREAVSHPDSPLAIQQQIRQAGTPGKRMFEGARQYIQARLPAYIQELAARLRARWEAG